MAEDAHGETGGRAGRARVRRHSSVRAFTLIELLVTISIIGVLLSLLLPAIRSAVEIARARKCQAGQRAVGFDFSIFADESLHGYRGSDARAGLFTMTSFIDAQYQVGDFWAWGSEDEVQVADSEASLPMQCPEVKGPLTLVRGRQAFEGGVAPSERLSFGFNVRLHQIEVLDSGGRPRAQRVRLTAGVLERPNVPLMWDIDPVAAAERGTNPLLSGPSLGSPGVFANDRYWFPGQRHNGKANYLFMDGHVSESETPLDEVGWEWGYTPPAR
jgi:prepilin-type processing-associated H-X9-DG protein/prepilin-type N-terminal cleavage/methylation domain-containing protein